MAILLLQSLKIHLLTFSSLHVILHCCRPTVDFYSLSSEKNYFDRPRYMSKRKRIFNVNAWCLNVCYSIVYLEIFFEAAFMSLFICILYYFLIGIFFAKNGCTVSKIF